MSGVKYTNVEKSSNFFTTLTPLLTLVAIAGIFAGVGMLGQVQKDVDNLTSVIGPMHVPASVRSPMPGVNTCAGKKAEIEAHFAGDLSNSDCDTNAIVNGVEQAGGNVTVGYVGDMDVGTDEPIKTPYYKQGMCPVNVHWHLGAEHLSVGEYDAEGRGPDDHSDHAHRKLLAGDARLGGRCHKYDSSVEMYTKEYDWQHCVGMHVGETYEVHWPHSVCVRFSFSFG